MARKRLIRNKGDVREFPRYSIAKAALYIRVPASTLNAWTRGQDYMTAQGIHRTFDTVIELADPENKLLSFYNLVEAHILRSTTKKGIPLGNVRKSLQYIRENISGEHPLLSHDFEVSGKEMFIRRLGQTINATRQGQLAMRKILEKYLKRVTRDATGFPIQVFPIHSRQLAIHPLISSGKPIVKGKGIAASVLWARERTGELIPEIAKDYGLTQVEVTQAIQDYAWKENRAA